MDSEIDDDDEIEEIEAPPRQATGTCLGEEFYIDRFWRFHVVFLDRDYDTHAQMKEAIERAQAVERRIAKKKPLHIEVLTTKGAEVAITGIHAGHQHVITKPAQDREDRREDYYPRVKWIAEAIAEIAKLEYRVAHIEAAIFSFKVDASPRAYRQSEANDHGERGEELQKAIGEAKKRAEKTNLEQMLLKSEPRKIRW